MKTFILLVLTSLFFLMSCKYKDNDQNNKLSAYPFFELSPTLKAVLESYMASEPKRDSVIKFYYLELVEMDQYHLLFRFTSKKTIEFVEKYPPLRYTKINDKFILFGMPNNKQIISNLKKDPLYVKYKINLVRNKIYDPICWEIEVRNDSIVNIDKTCSSWMKNPKGLRRKTDYFIVPKSIVP
jgi:hypothetical protein